MSTGTTGVADLPSSSREATAAIGCYRSATDRLQSVGRVVYICCCNTRSDLGIVTTIGTTYRRTSTASTTRGSRGRVGKNSTYWFINVSNGQDQSRRYIDLL